MLSSLNIFHVLAQSFEHAGSEYRVESTSNGRLLLAPTEGGQPVARLSVSLDTLLSSDSWQIKVDGKRCGAVREFLIQAMGALINKGNTRSAHAFLLRRRTEDALPSPGAFDLLFRPEFRAGKSGLTPELFDRLRADQDRIESGGLPVRQPIDPEKIGQEASLSFHGLQGQPAAFARYIWEVYGKHGSTLGDGGSEGLESFLGLVAQSFAAKRLQPAISSRAKGADGTLEIKVALLGGSRLPKRKGYLDKIASSPCAAYLPKNDCWAIAVRLDSAQGFGLGGAFFACFLRTPGQSRKRFNIASKADPAISDLLSELRHGFQEFLKKPPFHFWISRADPVSLPTPSAPLPKSLLDRLVWLARTQDRAWGGDLVLAFQAYARYSVGKAFGELIEHLRLLGKGMARHSPRVTGGEMEKIIQACVTIAGNGESVLGAGFPFLVSTLVEVLKPLAGAEPEILKDFECVREAYERSQPPAMTAREAGVILKLFSPASRVASGPGLKVDAVAEIKEAFFVPLRAIQSEDEIRELVRRMGILESRYRFDGTEVGLGRFMHETVRFALQRPESAAWCLDQLRLLEKRPHRHTLSGILAGFRPSPRQAEKNEHLLVFVMAHDPHAWDGSSTKSETLNHQVLSGIAAVFQQSVTDLIGGQDFKSIVVANFRILERSGLFDREALCIQLVGIIAKATIRFPEAILLQLDSALRKANIQPRNPAWRTELQKRRHEIFTGSLSGSWDNLLNLVAHLIEGIEPEMPGLRETLRRSLAHPITSLDGSAFQVAIPAERIKECLEILADTLSPDDPRGKMLVALQMVRLSTAVWSNAYFLTAAFTLLLHPSIPASHSAGLGQLAIKEFFMKAFLDAGLSLQDHENNKQLLTRDLGIALTEAERTLVRQRVAASGKDLIDLVANW
jgi:hypothetical protein